jgi:signal peptide peptidase SppA
MDNFFINPARLDAVRHRLIESANAFHLGDQKANTSWDEWADILEKYGTAPRSYKIVNGTAVIPARGALISCDIPYWFYFGDVSYEALAATVEHAVANPEVERVLLRINSPGGTVTGCAAAAARIDKAAGGDKPVWAHCSMADSAAYWLAAATNHIVVDPTGEAGSIGVITTHVDMSKMLEEWGIKVTHIYSGSHKADGSPYAPLSESALERMQADIDQLRGLFVDAVAQYRGLAADTVRATEALTFIGARAVAEGLADETGFFTDILTSMAERTSPGIGQPTATKQETSTMAKKAPQTPSSPAASSGDEKDGGQQDASTTKDDEEESAASAPADDNKDDPADERDDDKEAASDDSAGDDTAAATAERARIDAILSSPEAQGRQGLAQHLALKTGMSAKDAKAALAASPAESAKPSNPLADAMAKAGNPKTGADNGATAPGNALVEDMRRRFPNAA